MFLTRAESLRVGAECIMLDHGPVAVRTELGWVVSGRLESPVKEKGRLPMICVRYNFSSLRMVGQDAGKAMPPDIREASVGATEEISV